LGEDVKIWQEKTLLVNWEGRYIFAGYKNGKGSVKQDESKKVCIFKYKDG